MNVFILWMPNTIASHLSVFAAVMNWKCVPQKKNRFSAPQQKKWREKKSKNATREKKMIRANVCLSLSRCMCACVKWNMEARTDAVDCTRIILKRVYCIWCDDLVFFFRAAHTYTHTIMNPFCSLLAPDTHFFCRVTNCDCIVFFTRWCQCQYNCV